MKKYIKHIVFIFLMIIISVYTCYNLNSKTHYDKNYSKDFINAIESIRAENYNKSYEIIKNSSNEEKELIQTILLYKFLNEIDSYTSINEKINDEAENIIDYLTYTYLYERNTIYQKNIDEIYANEYNKLFDAKSKLPKEIMFEDVYDLYDKYFELIELDKDTFKNFEYKIKKNKSNLTKLIGSISEKLVEIVDLLKEVKGRHPSSSIPEEYMYLLNLK